MSNNMQNTEEQNNSTEEKCYIHSIWGLFMEGFQKYVMVKRPDGWYAVAKGGHEEWVSKEGDLIFNRAVEKGDWVETTFARAFGPKS